MSAQPAGSAANDIQFHQLVTSVRQGDFSSALQASTVALKTAPNDYRIWTLRGVALVGLQKKPEAQVAFEHALKVAPYYLPALEGEAQLKYQQGNDGARSFLLRVLTVRPDDPTTHAMLAVLDYRKKDCASAILQFQQAGAAISSQSDGLTMYGRCLGTLSRYEEAIPILNQALSLGPATQGARYNLALCQWSVGRNVEALATLQPLLMADQTSDRAFEFAAAVYESDGDTQNAIDLLRKAIACGRRVSHRPTFSSRN